MSALGRRLLREEQFLNPTPQFRQLTLVTNSGYSRYDALQVKVMRRLSHGLQALASYTLAKSMDNGSNDEIPVLPGIRVDPEADWGRRISTSVTRSRRAPRIFNQTNLGAPTNALGSGLFGQSTRTLASSLGTGGVAGGGFSPLYQVGGPRSVQLAARRQF